MRRQQGFTLLEVMVALGIFALLSTGCYQLLTSLSVSRATLDKAFGYRADVTKALLVIEQDMRHLIPRSVRAGGSVARIGALSSRGEGVLEFSRGGFSMGRSIYLDTAKRISYRLDEEDGEPVLYRFVYDVLDRVESSSYYRQALLTGVDEMDFRFMDENGSWLSEWPPRKAEDRNSEESAKEESGNLVKLPTAVEIALKLGPDTTIQRLISLR